MPRGPFALATMLAMIVLGLHLVAAHVAPSRLWGAAASGYLPPAAQGLLLLAAVLLALPPVARRGAAFLARGYARALRAPAWLPPLLAFGAFLALRSRNHFLGDGYFRLGELGIDRVNLRSADFLDLVVHRQLWRAMSAIGTGTPELTYALVSALAGAGAVALMPRVARHLVPDPSLRWTVPAFLLTMGSVQLYFGYVECYSLRECAVLLYILLALRALAGGSRLPATAALALAAALHLSSLALVPSLLVLYLDQDAGGVSPRRTAIALGWTSAAVAIVLAALYGFRHQYGGLAALLPLVPTKERAYGLFSPGHLADLGNFLLLVAPVGTLLLVVGTVHAVRRFGSGPASLLAQPRALFWLAAVLGPLGLLAFLDPKLGCRDWDLVALAGTPVTLAGLALLVGGTGRERARSLAAVAVIAWGVSAYHAASWVLANHDFQRSSAMVLAMVEHDPHHLSGPDPRLVNLGVEFNRRGLHEEAYDLQRRAIAIAPASFWAHFNLGTMLLEDRRLQEAVVELRAAVRSGPGEFRGHMQLGAVCGMLGRYPEAVTELGEAVRLMPESGDAHLNLGLSYLHGGDARAARMELETARRLLHPDPAVESNLAEACALLGDWQPAYDHAVAALGLRPGDPVALLRLGESALRLGRTDEGRAILADLAGSAPGSPEATHARGLLAGPPARDTGSSP